MNRTAKLAASLSVATLFLYLFVNKLDWTHVWRDARNADFFLVGIAACLMTSTYVVRSLRWRALLAGMAAPGWRALFRAVAIGFTALFLLGRAAEIIVRPAALSLKERVKPSASYATVLIERVFDMVTVVIFFAANLAFFQFSRSDPAAIENFRVIRIVGITLLIACACGVYGLSVFGRKSNSALAFLDGKLRRLPKRIYGALMNLLTHISEGLAMLHVARTLAVTLVYTALLWLIVTGAYVLVLRAFGIPRSQISYTGAVFVMGLSMLGSVIPTPGGATGPFHAAAAASLVFLGVERNLAASTAIVLHLVIFLPAVFFGFFYMLREGIAPVRLMRPHVESAMAGLVEAPVHSPNPGELPAVAAAQQVAQAAASPAAMSREPHRERG